VALPLGWRCASLRLPAPALRPATSATENGANEARDLKVSKSLSPRLLLRGADTLGCERSASAILPNCVFVDLQTKRFSHGRNEPSPLRSGRVGLLLPPLCPARRIRLGGGDHQFVVSVMAVFGYPFTREAVASIRNDV